MTQTNFKRFRNLQGNGDDGGFLEEPVARPQPRTTVTVQPPSAHAQPQPEPPTQHVQPPSAQPVAELDGVPQYARPPQSEPWYGRHLDGWEVPQPGWHSFFALGWLCVRVLAAAFTDTDSVAPAIHLADVASALLICSLSALAIAKCFARSGALVMRVNANPILLRCAGAAAMAGLAFYLRLPSEYLYPLSFLVASRVLLAIEYLRSPHSDRGDQYFFLSPHIGGLLDAAVFVLATDLLVQWLSSN